MEEVELFARGKKIFTCRLHTTFFSRLRGLMFSPKLEPRRGILISFSSERKIDLHMLFVFFPLDLIWVSGSGKIVQIERHVKPFVSYVRGTRAQSVLEVPAGAAQKLNVGNFLMIKLKREQS